MIAFVIFIVGWWISNSIDRVTAAILDLKKYIVAAQLEELERRSRAEMEEGLK